MAEAEEEKEDPKDKAAPTKKRSWLPVALIAVALLVVSGAGGAFVFLKKGSPKESGPPPTPEAKENHKGTNHGEAATANATGAIFDLDPFVVNLADTADLRYLKVTIKLELDQPTSKPVVEGHIPQIRDNLLVLLSSKDFASIRTVEGKMDLRTEIIQRLNTVLQGDIVKNAYFTEFVSQ